MEVNSNLKIFITGGEGFLRKHLIKEFSDKGIETFSSDITKGDDINDFSSLKNA